MSIFRPSNLNKRLVGTTDRSPGNGGQIGPNKTPYCGKCNLNTLGQRFFGGSCAGVFKTNESFCGSKERCQIICDVGGFLICRSGGIRWIVAPSTTEVSRSWGSNDSNIVAQAITGCTGWFVPTITQLQNPGFSCRTYWDSYSVSTYWSSTAGHQFNGRGVRFSDGYSSVPPKGYVLCVRSFRCVTY